jgi:uncharacterized protein YndB with AHSA1/START domain
MLWNNYSVSWKKRSEHVPFEGISIRRFLQAKPDRIFEAWTRPELIVRWFYPGDNWKTVASSDLKVGGRYEVEMREPTGTLHKQFGEYLEIQPVSRLAFTWNCPELGVERSIVTVELIDHGNQTELLLTHELPPDPVVRNGHEQGWLGCLNNLEKLLILLTS